MTLTPFDDYPIHQTTMPVAHRASGDRNHYDRYWFNGYDVGGEWFFAVAMGLYPNRRVIDGAFSVVRGGVQRSVFASGRAPLDPAETRVGPISVEVVQPLRTLRVRVDAGHLGIDADLVWHARTIAVEEPRITIEDGHVTILDSTRLVQWGTWRGTIDVDGQRIEVAPDHTRGTRDRSWGIRPVGESPGGAPTSSLAGGGIFFLWAPINFEDDCTHAVVYERPDGQRWYWSALRVPVIGEAEPVFGTDETIRHASDVVYRIAYEPGTRRARTASLVSSFTEESSEELEFEPILRFHMKGLGYWHPKWAHGVWQGERAEGADEWRIDDLDPLDPANVHVEQLCRVRRGSAEGIGVLEQLVLGPHEPTGLEDFLDGG
ncbi:MAG: hypothetical protein ABR600_02480 [Actinomycetota bacterium]